MEEVINQLAQSTLLKTFKDDITSEFTEDNPGSAKNCDDNEVFHDTVGTSRDYLAKLLFWLVNSPCVPFRCLPYLEVKSGQIFYFKVHQICTIS